ncbi:hypothetical protein N7461_005632 [Penicillium sp. DV-2018c]|nr:hypothetical protein N7461_005632 [Penicillium sp. DV-2018c]
MKLHSKGQYFEFEPEVKFLYTHVILQDDTHYYSVEVPERHVREEDIPDISSHPSLRRIPPEHIWPKMEPNLTICPNPESPGIYIKRPDLPSYRHTPCLGLWLLHEARMCELLINKSHKNIAQYLGCVVENDRITGLCFQKYEETLAHRLCDGRYVNNEDCLRQVAAGLDYLHSLDIVHNDIRADNVMFKTQHDDVPIVVDFDSSAIRGSPLPDKRRVPPGIRTAEFENDAYGLEMLRREIVEEQRDQEFLRKNYTADVL